MNKILLFLLLSIFCGCSATVNRSDASISFSETEHNFGTVPYQKEAAYSFSFSNPGKTNLIIYDVKTSCGCTIPEWTKKPLETAEAGEIGIKYDAAFPGVFHKTITVYYNGKESPVTLTIKGEVEYPEETNRK